MMRRQIRLDGYRILVVGASSGIGRALGIQAARVGARVAFAARRIDFLEKAVREAGGSSLALKCDVRDEDDCFAVVERAADDLSGLDAVVYCAGMSPLVRVDEADAALWRKLFETNVIGASQIARAAMPHLGRSHGRMIFLGSSSVGRPYPGLVPYATTKAALQEMVVGWRNEFPSVRMTTFVVGPTITEFAAGWDSNLAAEMLRRWAAEGYGGGPTLSSEAMAAEVLWVLATDAEVEEVRVMPGHSSH